MLMRIIHCRRGFTLIEVLAVIVLLGIMAAIVAPAISGSGSRLRDDAAKLSSLIRYMDDVSATRKEEVRLEFDFTGQGTVIWSSSVASGSEKYRSLAGVELPSRGLVKEGQLIVFFNPSSVPEQMKIYLARDDQHMAVLYNPISRRVKVIEPEDDEKKKD